MALILPARSTVEKTERGFCSSPVMRKNLSRIFKIHLHFPRIRFERRHGETGKKWQKYEKVVFFAIGGIPDPP
jgi:hypothetical protein